MHLPGLLLDLPGLLGGSGGFPGGPLVKNPPANAGDAGSRSLGREDPLEKGVAIHSSDFCLENPTDRGAKQATIHGAAESDTTE